MATQVSKRNSMKFLEGFIEHKGQDSKWRSFWCVLRDRIVYIFDSEDKETSKENHIGTLEINNETRFIIGESDQKRESFRFDLRTTRHLNKFRTKRFSERELWRGYVVGVGTGTIPQDLDLMTGQIRMIEDEINVFYDNKQTPTLPRRPSIGGGSLPSGFSNPAGTIEEIFPDYPDMDPANNGGPFMKHRFWSNANRTDIPSWFFSNCTREVAEKILIGCSEFGNCLMRESLTFRESGSYTITKRVALGRNPISHYEVMRVQSGYKINAENAPDTFRCLSETMEHFVHMSGAAATQVFKTNDYHKLGLEPPNYTTKIARLNDENGEEYQSEPYLVPAPVPYVDGSKTLPNRNIMSSFRPYPPTGTQVGPRDRNPRAGLEYIEQSTATAGALSNLDRVIRQHDEDNYRARKYSEYKDIKYLGVPPEPPLAPLEPADPSQKIVRKTTRSHSVPAVQFNNLNINVPISKDPGMVKRSPTAKEPENPYSKRPLPSIEDPYKSRSQVVDDPYRKQESDPYNRGPSQTDSDPYKSVTKQPNMYDPHTRNNQNIDDVDPYTRRQQQPGIHDDPYKHRQQQLDNPEDPYKHRQQTPDNPDDPYKHRQQTLDNPDDPYRHGQQQLDNPDDPYRHRQQQLDNPEDPYRHRQKTLDNPEDPYRRTSTSQPSQSQLYQNIQCADIPVSPVSSPKSPNQPRPISGISGGDDSQLLGDIQATLNKLKPTRKSHVDTPPVSSKTSSIPPPVAKKSTPSAKISSTPNTTPSLSITRRQECDNASSGSGKDINGNNKAIEEITSGSAREDFKKRLEMTLVPRPMLPKCKSVPNIPLPALPIGEESGEEMYMVIPETDE